MKLKYHLGLINWDLVVAFGCVVIGCLNNVGSEIEKPALISQALRLLLCCSNNVERKIL